MRINSTLILLAILFCFSVSSPAQLWSGILNPTSGGGACSYGKINSAGQCAVDWTQVGIPGGIPTNWAQSGATIQASACGGGSSDCTSTIQSALNSCAGTSLPGKYVQLGNGTFLINGNLQVKSYCKLVGGGPQSTVLNCMGTSGSCVHEGVTNDAPYKNGTGTITGGATAGSTSLTISAGSIGGTQMSQGLTVGGYLVISELSDPIYVSGPSPQNPGNCTYCDAIWNGTRLREQIVQITSLSGSGPYTVGITPALYSNYGIALSTAPAYATPFGVLNGGAPDCIYCGIESLQIYANGTGLNGGMSDINLTECAYCWVYRVEANYTDADWLDAFYCYRCEIRDNYFFNAFGHGAGGSDADIEIGFETSASLIINNITERGHSSVIVDWGAAGNVIAYNYSTGSVDAVGIGANQIDFAQHGAFPQFNLFEGNVGPNWQPDSWHGNEGYNTVFRNWWRGSNAVAPYLAQAINSISCSGGTCTISWASGSSSFYAGSYVAIWGTSNVGCGSQPNIAPNSSVWALTGPQGSLSSTFAQGGCSNATGGWAATMDLSAYPTPITHRPLDWTTNVYNTYQTMWAITIPAFSVGNNLVGNVLGSSQQMATVGQSYMYDSGSGACSSCIRASTTRDYLGIGSEGGGGYISTYNYDTSGDSNGSDWASFPGGPSNTTGYWSDQGFTTTFYHGNFDVASTSTIWNVNGNGSQTLPQSFFMSSKPAWFGSVTWPAIGPDVTGGPDSATGGHANYIPAQVCYNSTSRDSTGAKEFNPGACYDNSNAPAPPTGLTAVVQ